VGGGICQVGAGVSGCVVRFVDRGVSEATTRICDIPTPQWRWHLETFVGGGKQLAAGLNLGQLPGATNAKSSRVEFCLDRVKHKTIDLQNGPANIFNQTAFPRA